MKRVIVAAVLLLGVAYAADTAFGGLFPATGQAVGGKRTTDGKMVPLSVDGTGALLTTGGGSASPVTTVTQGTSPWVVSGSVTASNPSVSPVGTTAPGSATYAGMNVGGNLVGLTGTATGAVDSLNVAVRDGAGNDLEFAKENDNFNAADHGILVLGRDIDSTPDKYRVLRLDGNGSTYVVGGAANNVDAEAVKTTGVLEVEAYNMSFNGTTWDRVRGGGTNADAVPTLTLGAVNQRGFLYGFNGTTWDRVRTANTGRLQIDVVTVPTTTVTGTVAATQSGTWNIGTVTTVTSVTNPVTVTDGAGALNVIVDSSALPTGAATETTVAAMSAKLPAALGPQLATAALSTGPSTVATAIDAGTCTNVTASTTILASNTARKVAVILNNGSANVHVKLGATATTGNPPLAPGQSFTVEGASVYTGVIDVIASSGTQSVCAYSW